MAQYSSCPNCNNSEENNVIYKCNECGKIYCEACCGNQPWHSSPCPSCKHSNYRTIGRIEDGE